MFMKLLKFFTGTLEKEKPGKFSDFFLNASEEKKEKVLREAARKSNEEQLQVFTKSQLKVRAK